MQGVDALHLATGLPYWATIVCITISLRTIMLPLAIGTMRNSARMAVMKPEMELVTERMKNDPNVTEPETKAIYEAELRNLFVKHDCSPMRSFAFPLAQAPVFMSFFFGLKVSKLPKERLKGSRVCRRGVHRPVARVHTLLSPPRVAWFACMHVLLLLTTIESLPRLFNLFVPRLVVSRSDHGRLLR
jgi:hypothetical protein